MKKLLPFLVVLACLAIPPFASSDDDLAKALRNQQMIDNSNNFNEALQAMIKEIGEHLAAKARFDWNIADARAKFWATYPDKPGFKQAQANFGKLLYSKDLYYMVLMKTYSGSGLGGSIQMHGNYNADWFKIVETMDLGKLDHSIPQT